MSHVLTAGGIDLNDGVNTVLLGFSLGKPDRTAEEFSSPGIDLAMVGAVDMSGLVDSVFRVGIIGTSVDDATARVAAIADELAALSPITIGLDGSAYTGTLTPKIASCTEIPVDSKLIQRFTTVVDLAIRRDPYVLAPTETLYNVSGIDAPALVSLAAQTGQYATPQDILLDAGALTLAGCYVGHTADEAAVIGDFVKPLVAATWSAGAAAADAAGYPAGAGNTVWGHTAAAYTDVDVTTLPAGEYLVLANVKGTAVTVATIKHAFCDPVPIPTTALKLLSLGLVSLPTQAVRGAATSALRFTITGDAGANSAYVNYVALLPVSRGLTGYVAATHVHTLRWEDGTLYADDAVDLARVVGGVGPMRVLGGQLVILAENATAAPTTHLHVTASDDPRWEQFPSL